MNIDLNSLSQRELKDLQSRIARAISSYEDRRKKEVLAELEEKAREMGYSLAELTGVAQTRKRAPAAAKYANPDDPSQTWTGRGRQPRWFAAALAAGRSAQSMTI
jgi:DNA-binding protein H-NS